MEALRVAIVSSHHPSQEGMGISHVVSWVSRYFAAWGHDVLVYYPTGSSAPSEESPWHGVRAEAVPPENLHSLPFARELGYSRAVARRLPKDLDVVVVNNELGGAPVLQRVRRLQRQRKDGRPLGVSIMHGRNLDILRLGKGQRPAGYRPFYGYYADHVFLEWLEGGGARSADLCIACSSAVRETLVRDYRVLPERVRVVYNGAEPKPERTVEGQAEARRSLELRADRRYLLFVARDPFRKGFDVAKGAVGLLRGQGLDVELLNVGNTEPSGEGVRSYGSVSDAMRDSLLLACDAFFLPTRYEGMPLVLQEAAAQGIPIVTTPEANLDLGAPGRDFLCVAPNTPEAHAEALEPLLRGREDPRLLGARGRMAIGSRGYDLQAEELLALIEAKLKSGPRGGVLARRAPSGAGPSSSRTTITSPPAVVSALASGLPPSSTRPPYLTVVIIAWKRKQYIRSAVESIFAAPFPRRDLQLLVVKGFEDPELDAWLDSRGVEHAYCEATPSGAKHALGLSMARGEVVCWLDDDDDFVPEKLGVVAEVFRSDPNLSFYHHGHTRIDPDGRVLGPGPFIPDFNCSSMAVRRRDALSYREAMSRTNAICDTLQCYAMMALGREGRQDPGRALTLYRMSATPHTSFRLLPAYLALAKEIKELGVGSSGRTALANVTRIYFSTLARTKTSSRQQAAEALALAVSTLEAAPYVSDLREVVCASLHPISPGLSRLVYLALCGGKVDWLPVPAG